MSIKNGKWQIRCLQIKPQPIKYTNTSLPTKEWRVVPAITDAAAPVLAVATVTSGGKAPIIFRRRNDFPVPALPKHKKIQWITKSCDTSIKYKNYTIL